MKMNSLNSKLNDLYIRRSEAPGLKNSDGRPSEFFLQTGSYRYAAMLNYLCFQRNNLV